MLCCRKGWCQKTKVMTRQLKECDDHVWHKQDISRRFWNKLLSKVLRIATFNSWEIPIADFNRNQSKNESKMFCQPLDWITVNKVSCKVRCLCKVFIQCIFIVRLLCARHRARCLEYGWVHRYSPCKPQNAHKNHWQCYPNILEPSCKQIAHRVNSGMFFNVYTLFFQTCCQPLKSR